MLKILSPRSFLISTKYLIILALLLSIGLSRGSISGQVKFLGDPMPNALVKLYLNGVVFQEKRTNFLGVFFWLAFEQIKKMFL